MDPQNRTIWQYTSRTAGGDRSLQDLEQQLNRALLTMEAMWTLLMEKTGLTEDDLRDRIVEVDLRDGVLDGQLRKPAMECASCGKRIPRKHQRCIYCGESVKRDPFG